LTESAKAVSTRPQPIPGRTPKSFANILATAMIATILVALGITLDARSETFDAATQSAAKSFDAKMQTLQSKDDQPAYPAVIIIEHEANSYLKVHSGDSFPLGVHTPSVKVEPEHAMANANVDFDELSRSYPNQTDWGPKVLSAMFKGTQPVTVTAKIQNQASGVLFQVESVVVGSTTVPNWLVDYIIQNVLQPKYHFDLSKPLPYPDHVKQIVLGSGQVTFLRGPKGGK